METNTDSAYLSKKVSFWRIKPSGMRWMWRFVEGLFLFYVLTLKMKIIQSFETLGIAAPSDTA